MCVADGLCKSYRFRTLQAPRSRTCQFFSQWPLQGERGVMEFNGVASARSMAVSPILRGSPERKGRCCNKDQSQHSNCERDHSSHLIESLLARSRVETPIGEHLTRNGKSK